MGAVQMRLATPGLAGANLYNSYQFLAQLAALYIKARRGDVNVGALDEWVALSDSALSDLGVLVALWEGQIGLPVQTNPLLEDAKTSARVVRVCRRAERLETICNEWTPVRKWIRTMGRLEASWGRVIDEFCRLDPTLAPQLVQPIESCKRRRVRLEALLAQHAEEIRSLDAAWQVPTSLVESKGGK